MASEDVAQREALQQPPPSALSILTFDAQSLPQNYVPLILSKWLRSLKSGNDYFRLIDRPSYFKAYDTYIKNLIFSPKSRIKIAYLSDDPDVVLGFSLTHGTTLHYVHVHAEARRRGIGTLLLPAKFEKFSHITKHAIAIWPKYPNAIFDPFT